MKILTCSGLDSTKAFRKEYKIQLIPLKIAINNKEYIDDESLDTQIILDEMHKSSESPKTSCPSPHDFISHFKEDVTNFVITISSHLSGTYNSAMMAKEMYEESHENARVHIIDSLTASAGGVPIVMKLQELYDGGLRELELVEEINKFISTMKTIFVIDSLENLTKAGRMTATAEKIANLLDIKPVMQTIDGQIKLLKKARGHKRATKALLDEIGNTDMNLANRVMSISHSYNEDKALKFKEAVEERYKFKKIIINETLGLSTVYTGGGGLVISF